MDENLDCCFVVYFIIILVIQAVFSGQDSTMN
jgi:hypothetical protein